MTEQNTMPSESVLERIRKAAALMDSPNEHEAAAAAAMVQNLLLKHNLSLADVRSKNGSKHAYITMSVPVPSARWRQLLLDGIAKTNFCRAIIAQGNREMMILGERHNVEVVVWLNGFIAAQVQRLGTEWGDEYGAGRTARTAFRLGAVTTVRKRLRDARAQAVQESAATNALVVMTDAALDEAYRKAFPRARSTGASVRDANAYARGQAAGNNVTISNAVGAGTRALRG